MAARAIGTYPSFELHWISRRKLHQFSTTVISLDAEHFTWMVNAYVTYWVRPISRIRRRRPKIIGRVGYKRPRIPALKLDMNDKETQRITDTSSSVMSQNSSYPTMNNNRSQRLCYYRVEGQRDPKVGEKEV